MADYLIGLWLLGAQAWIAAAHKLSWAEMQREQARVFDRMAAQATCLWSGAWMFPAPKRRPLTERMAALSLRVVEGGRR
jgi:hypothetical protein